MVLRTRFELRLLPILAGLLGFSSVCFSDDPPRVNYNRDVRPILSDKCYQCHGPDENARSTELRLDVQASALSLLESGAKAVVPKSVGESEVIRRVTSTYVDERMPPPDAGDCLSDDEIDTLKRWIQQGADWGKHWSFVPPRRPELPRVSDPDWPVVGIDCFVLAELDRNKWKPSPPADKRTLIRRATLAATGLPPTRQAIHDFLADTSEGAYERVVDRLLHSPRYGEHQARYWLDVARYGDTHGLHLDNERTIWRYRDWVIDAFNVNMPFDQFTIEQLAGDLLPNPTLSQRIATGFHRCNVTTSEGGAIAEEFLARYAVDRVETTAAVWLGLTAGCAACHDHKFDPISQTEFYQLYAYFYNLTEKAMDGNAKLPPPAIKAPTYLQQLRHKELQAEKQVVEAELEQIRSELRSDRSWEEQFAKSVGKFQPPPSDWSLHLSMNDTSSLQATKIIGKPESVPGNTDSALSFDGKSRLEFDGFGNFERDGRFSFGAWVRIDSDDAHTVLSRMDDDTSYRGFDLYIAARKVYVHIIHRWPDDALRVNTTLPLRKEKWQHVMATYDGSGKADGITIYVDGVAQDLDETHDSLKGSIRTDEPFRVGQRKKAAVFKGELDELMVFHRCLSSYEVQAIVDRNPLAEYLARQPSDREPKQDREVLDAYMRTNPASRAVLDRLTMVKKQLSLLDQAVPSTLVMEERKEPRDAYILVRGEYDKKGDRVFPNVPAALPKSSAAEQNRFTLAQWLVDDQHPLTARVTVNRIWQQYFGVGLVKTSEDFGSQGEWPSHPMLLDYLATELVASGWNLKALHRQILLSATFRQSSRRSARAQSQDPENRLLSQGPRFRMDAEMIRDFAMATSGLLVGEVGGPSVKPYQPKGLWNAVGYTTSNTANFRVDSSEKLYRRGMYTFWKRTSPPPQMQILDAPSREVCTVRRPRTNTPGAALLLMNDVQFVEAARKLAERVLLESKTRRDRLTAVYEICLARVPRDSERQTLDELLRSMQAEFDKHPQRAADLLAVGESKHRYPKTTEMAAWTIVCSTVMNLDEAINQH